MAGFDLHQWKDASGRLWTVFVNVNVISECRKLLQIDLAAAPQALVALAEDVVLLVDVLYQSCKQQAESSQISKDEFAGLLVGDVLDSASKALEGAIIDFFPSSRQREMLKKLREKRETMILKTEEMGHRQMENPKLDSAMDAAIKKAEMEIEARWDKLGDSSTNSPVTSV